jgi:hypothetical protein
MDIFIIENFDRVKKAGIKKSFKKINSTHNYQNKRKMVFN